MRTIFPGKSLYLMVSTQGRTAPEVAPNHDLERDAFEVAVIDDALANGLPLPDATQWDLVEQVADAGYRVCCRRRHSVAKQPV